MRRLTAIVACLVLPVLVAGCNDRPTPTAAVLGADDARAIAVATFTDAHRGGGALTNVTATVELTPGVKVGPNAGRQVWTVKVDGTVTDANGTRYDSHFWIEVDPATGVATVIGRG